MTQIDSATARGRIRQQIRTLAEERGLNAARLNDNELIPEAGLLDSASLMVLIVWFEQEFSVSTEVEELTLDNFGSINLMVDYLERHA